ncbi:MAG TPA: hypothetical protein VLM90_01045 [Candidatus Deferrimicrobium sp.]|nr:hypothetical protein [Candidatus Deferrimicrobium sp.]
METSTSPDQVLPTKVEAQLISQSLREAEIERLAGEIGRLIQDSDPESREELAQSANSLLREQGLRLNPASVNDQVVADARRRPLNPLAAGIGLIMVGAAITLLLPFVGLTLAACGVLAVLWGVLISTLKK